MSVQLLSDRHLSVLVNAAMRLDLNPLIPPDALTDQRGETHWLFCALRAANVAAYAARYSHFPTDVANAEICLADARAGRAYMPAAQQMNPLACLKLVHCCQYNCHLTDPTGAATHTAQLLLRLERRLLSELPDYADAEWAP